MKEFKTFIVCIVFFFLAWIVIAYLFAGTVVLVSGFSEHLLTTVNQPGIVLISFLAALVGAIILGNEYYEHLKSK